MQLFDFAYPDACPSTQPGSLDQLQKGTRRQNLVVTAPSAMTKSQLLNTCIASLAASNTSSSGLTARHLSTMGSRGSVSQRSMLSSAAAEASGSKKYSWMMTSQSCSWRAAIHWLHGRQALPGRAIGHGGVVMCCAGPMLLACVGNSLWQLVLEWSIFACQKPVLL